MSIKQKFIDLVIRGRDMFSPKASKAGEELKKLQAEFRQSSDELKRLERTQNDIAKARGLELYAERSATSLRKAQEEVARLAREIDRSNKPTKEQAEALSAARRSANQLQTEYNRLNGQLARSRVDLQQAGINTRLLATEQSRLQREIRQNSENLSVKRTRLAALRAELNSTTKSTGVFGESLRGVTNRLLAFGGAYLGLRTLRNAMMDVFRAGDQFERLDIQMTGVMGSIEAGEQASAWIQEFTKKTPLQLEEVTEAFVKLRNFGLDPMDGTLAKIIDMSEKLGGGWQKAEAISRALGEAWGKQRLQGQEILQLINAGVPVWELLEKVTGKNAAEVRKLSEAGKIGREVMRDLIDEIGRSAEGQAQKGMQTMSGLVSNLRDNITRFYVQIANSGALDVLKQQLNAVNEQFERMAADGSLARAAEQISNFLGSIVKTSGDALNSTIRNMQGIIRTLSFITNTIRIVFNGVSAGLFLIASSFTKAVSLMMSWWGKLASFIGANNIADSLKEQAGAMQAVTDAYFSQFEQDAKDIADAWDNMMQAVSSSNDAATANLEANSQRQVVAIDAATQAERDRVREQQRLQEMITNSGIVTLESLKNTEQAALETYEAVKAAADEGQLSSYEVEQAYNAWAEAALKVAGATKTAVPETLKLEAANLGLTNSLEKLIERQGLSADLTKDQGQGFTLLQNEINKTEAAIALYKDILKDSTKSVDAKTEATTRLFEAEQRLKMQLETLAKLEELRTKSYFDVKLALEEAQRQADRLTESYKSGIITTQQYNEQIEQQRLIIQSLQSMLPSVTAEKEKFTEAQRKAGQEVRETTEAIDEQSGSLRELADKAAESATATSLYADAQQHLSKEFDLNGKSIEELMARHRELQGLIVENMKVGNRWSKDLSNISDEGFRREQQIISETLQVRRFTEELQNSAITLDQIRRINQVVNTTFNQLGDNDLAPLRNAIRDAENRIASLRDGIQGTLASLQDEMDRLNDNQAAIEKRRYEQQIAELQAKLQQAQESGDQDSIRAAQQALTLAREINKIKQDTIKAEQEARKQAERERAEQERERQANQQQAQQQKTQPQQAAPARPQPVVLEQPRPATTTGRMVLELVLPGSQRFNAEMDARSAEQMMRHLERIRSTSL